MNEKEAERVIMNKNNNELNLSINEKILYTTEPIDGESKKKNYTLPYSFGTCACVMPFLLTTISLIGLMTNRNLYEPFFIGFMLITTFFIILGIFMVFNYFNRYKRTFFYITNRNIIKFKNHAFKIKKENLSHFLCHYRSLIFVSKRKNGTSFYNGTENQTKYTSKRKTKQIFVPLLGELGEKVKNEMKDIVIKSFSMQEHPNIKNLYIPKK